MKDTIYRKDAIGACAYETVECYEARKAIRALPSAGRPQGEWIKHEHGFWTFVNDRGERDGWLPDYECNLCGSRAWRYASNYCPNCGAKMFAKDTNVPNKEGVDNEHDK